MSDQSVSRTQAIVDQTTPLAARVAAREGCELVSISYLSESGGWLLRVVIDRGGAVSVEHCARVSRQLSTLLDVEDFIEGHYSLEVSSPGLQDELLVAADFARYAGQRIRVIAAGEGGEPEVTRGKLRGLVGGAVVMDGDDGGRISLPRAQISEARLEVEI